MAALADLDAYLAGLATPDQIVPFSRLEPGTTAGGAWMDMFIAAAPTGSAPGAAAVPTNATAGALAQSDGGSGVLRVLGAHLTATAANGGMLMLCDRLSHQSGLSGTATTAQTTNLPTAALTRYTSGVGVMAAITIHTTIGTTAADVTVSYTNTAGTSGRTSPARRLMQFTGDNRAGHFIPLPLQSGDLGVKSVESVTASANTGTPGNYGVTLYKPLAMFPLEAAGSRPFSYFDSMIGGLDEIVDGACLFWAWLPKQDNAAAQALSGALLLSED